MSLFHGSWVPKDKKKSRSHNVFYDLVSSHAVSSAESIGHTEQCWHNIEMHCIRTWIPEYGDLWGPSRMLVTAIHSLLPGFHCSYMYSVLFSFQSPWKSHSINSISSEFRIFSYKSSVEKTSQMKFQGLLEYSSSCSEDLWTKEPNYFPSCTLNI